MSTHFLQPFVLRSRRLIPAAHNRDLEKTFDPKRQLWVVKETGEAVVTQFEKAQQQRTQWGETIMTKTSEGHDQSEGLRSSAWGETAITESGEGHDQAEVLSASTFGETFTTATGEGVDHSEAVDGG